MKRWGFSCEEGRLRLSLLFSSLEHWRSVWKESESCCFEYDTVVVFNGLGIVSTIYHPFSPSIMAIKALSCRKIDLF